MIVKQIETKKEQPTTSDWYDTDAGNLFWMNDIKEWSCRDDRLSEEYPKFWYEPQPKVNNLDLHNVSIAERKLNAIGEVVDWFGDTVNTITRATMCDIINRI